MFILLILVALGAYFAFFSSKDKKKLGYGLLGAAVLLVGASFMRSRSNDPDLQPGSQSFSWTSLNTGLSPWWTNSNSSSEDGSSQTPNFLWT